MDLFSDLIAFNPNFRWALILFGALHAFLCLSISILLIAATYAITSKLDPFLKKIADDRSDTEFKTLIPSRRVDRTYQYALMTVSPKGYHGYGSMTHFDFKGVLGSCYGITRALGWFIQAYQRFLFGSIVVVFFAAYINLFRNFGFFSFDEWYFQRIQEKISASWPEHPQRLYELVLTLLFTYVFSVTTYVRQEVLPSYRDVLKIIARIQFQFQAPPWLYGYTYAFHCGMFIGMPWLYQGRLRRANYLWQERAHLPLKILCFSMALSFIAFLIGLICYILRTIYVAS